MKTVIASSLITLLLVFSALQFQQINQLKSANQEISGNFSNRLESIRVQFWQALNAQNESVIREIDKRINKSDDHTSGVIAGLNGTYPSKLAFDNLKSEHEGLQTQVDQLKRDLVDDNHNLSQSIYRLSESVKASK